MGRVNTILKKPFVITLIAILIGFLVASGVLIITNYSPVDAFSIMFTNVFSKPKYLANIVIKATPIILTGISFSFAFKVGLFNIGAEGQYITGAVVSTMVGILLDLPPIIQYPVVVLSGVVAGALFGAIVGILKSQYGINEVITGIMLNWIAFYFNNFIVNLKLFHKPNSTGSYEVSANSFDIIYNWKKSTAGKNILIHNNFLREAVGKTDMNVGIIIAIIVAIMMTILLNQMTKGFELRAVGKNPEAAEAAGINVQKNMFQTMLIAGAIAGLAGALQTTGVLHKISSIGAFENYGFNGMSVALIANASPLGCILSGFLFAGLIYGGGSIQSQIGAPSELINIMIGTIVFVIAVFKIVPLVIDRFFGKEVE